MGLLLADPSKRPLKKPKIKEVHVAIQVQIRRGAVRVVLAHIKAPRYQLIILNIGDVIAIQIAAKRNHGHSAIRFGTTRRKALE